MCSSCNTFTLQNFNPVDLVFADIPYFVILHHCVHIMTSQVLQLAQIKIPNNAATKNVITIEQTPFFITLKALPSTGKLLKFCVIYNLRQFQKVDLHRRKYSTLTLHFWDNAILNSLKPNKNISLRNHVQIALSLEFYHRSHLTS